MKSFTSAGLQGCKPWTVELKSVSSPTEAIAMLLLGFLVSSSDRNIGSFSSEIFVCSRFGACSPMAWTPKSKTTARLRCLTPLPPPPSTCVGSIPPAHFCTVFFFNVRRRHRDQQRDADFRQTKIIRWSSSPSSTLSSPPAKGRDSNPAETSRQISVSSFELRCILLKLLHVSTRQKCEMKV